MKTFAITALAALSLGLTAMPANAGHCHHVTVGYGVPTYVSVRYTAPYVVSTSEVGRNTFVKVGFDHHGHPFRFVTTVVTYRSFYSDGSTQTYTRTFRG